MLRRHIVLLIAIRPSDGDVKNGGPLGAFREKQIMSRHRVSPSPFLSSSSHTTQLRYTNSYTCSYPNLNFLQYTIQILIPHVMWFVQVVRASKIGHIQRHLSVMRGTRSALKHTQSIERGIIILMPIEPKHCNFFIHHKCSICPPWLIRQTSNP